jgi:hypothetical protein
MIESYFGLPDSAHEDPSNILSDHVLRSFEDSIKCDDRTTGKQVIVGIKGSGKTELRRYLEKKKKKPSWNIDVDNTHLNIDPVVLKGRSGVLKNTLSFELLRSFGQYLSAHPEEFGLPKQQNSLKDKLSKALEIIQNIPEAVDVKTPLGNIRLAELLKSKASSFVNNATTELLDGVLASLADKQVYIMIDDADDVFPGLEENPVFVEGLARAVNDINRLAGTRIHVLLFLKYGVWRRWFEHQQEYDKVAHIIQEISWTDQALRELIALRIARLHNVKPQGQEGVDVENMWKKEFEWPNAVKFEDFAERFTRLCLSGPRDMIELANASKANAKTNKISQAHLDAITPTYSENKLFGIGADFDGVYSDISKFIEMVFQGCSSKMSGDSAATWIEKHGLTDKRVDKYFESHEWYTSASRERLVGIMYEVGLFGRLRGDNTVEYAIQRPNVSTSELLGSTLYVHPALQPHLAVQTSSSKIAPSAKQKR